MRTGIDDPLRWNAHSERPASPISSSSTSSTSSDAPRAGFPPGLTDDILAHRRLFLIGGIGALVVGLAAVALPHLATFATEVFFASLLLVNGALGLFGALRALRRDERASRVAMGCFVAAIALVAGFLMLANPVAGVVALTIVIAAFLLASGVIKAWFALRLRPVKGWKWMMGGASMSVLLGVLITTGLPGTAIWVLGLMVGVDLIFHGVALLALVRSATRSAQLSEADGAEAGGDGSAPSADETPTLRAQVGRGRVSTRHDTRWKDPRDDARSAYA